MIRFVKGRSQYLVDETRLEGMDLVQACRHVLTAVSADIASFECDIPWSQVKEWPAEVQAAAENLASLGKRGGGPDDEYGRTGVVSSWEADQWAAFVSFVPYAFDATCWDKDFHTVVSIADTAHSIVAYLTSDVAEDLNSLLGPDVLVPEKRWRRDKRWRALPGRPCPCCGHRTLFQLRVYELCPVCWWEDDPDQADHPWSRGGANGISLVEAQQAYQRHGAAQPELVSEVRPARAGEDPEPGWRPYDPTSGEIDEALLNTDEESRAAETQGRQQFAEYRTALTHLRSESSSLGHAAVQRRVRELSIEHYLHYGEAEVELVSFFIADPRWSRHHPVRALAWAWRHRKTTRFLTRLHQVTHFQPLE